MHKLNTATSRAPVTFRELIRGLADDVGRHQIPIRDRAADIHALLGSDAVHHELITNLVRAIYKSNGCGHLDAPVNSAQTFNALGVIRSRLRRTRHCDVDQIFLIDNIGSMVRKRLDHIPIRADPATGEGRVPMAHSAAVVAISRARD